MSLGGWYIIGCWFLSILTTSSFYVKPYNFNLCQNWYHWIRLPLWYFIFCWFDQFFFLFFSFPSTFRLIEYFLLFHFNQLPTTARILTSATLSATCSGKLCSDLDVICARTHPLTQFHFKTDDEKNSNTGFLKRSISGT